MHALSGSRGSPQSFISEEVFTVYRYYLTQRPAMPGTFPKPQGNRVLSIENYDERTFCEEIGREAWGYVEYEKPVSEVLLRNFEMAEGGNHNDKGV